MQTPCLSTHFHHTVALIHVGTERDRIRMHTVRYAETKKQKILLFTLIYIHRQTLTLTRAHTHTHTALSPFTHKLHRKTHNKKMLKKGEHMDMNTEQVFSLIFFFLVRSMQPST